MKTRGSRVAEWYGAGLFFLYVLILFMHAAPPSMTDYANWTYQGVLLARHVQGFADPAHALKSYPVPNSAASVGVGLLTLLLPWQLAAKFWLCLQLLITFAALRHLTRTIQASAAAWLIVPQAVFLGVNWWYGFVNFELGLAWVLLMASMLLRRARGETGREWKMGAVLVLAFFTHMIPFAFCGLLVILYARQTGRWRVLWQMLPAALLSVWYLAGRYLVAGDADGQAGMVSSVRNYSVAFWAYKANSYLKSFGFANPGELSGSVALSLFGNVLFVTLFLCNLALCVLLGWCMVRAAMAAYREHSVERFLWTGMLALVPVYLLAPGAALGVSDPGSRLLQVGLALGVALCCRAGGRLMQAASACAVVLAMAAVVLFARAGFGPSLPASAGSHVPHAVVVFGHAPNHDQDYFYSDLEQGNYRDKVFPTGMLLNRGASERPQNEAR